MPGFAAGDGNGHATIDQASQGGSTEDDDFTWGPDHPCYPHLNVHVPLTAELYDSTRLIRVRRDWMQVGDLAPTFANLYPEVLDPIVPEDEFRKIIKHINDEIIAAFSPWSLRAWVDSIMGVATGWLWDDFGFTGVKKRLRDLEAWLERWNRDVGQAEGVRIIPLRRTAYMTVSLGGIHSCIAMLILGKLDFQIPDPQISVDASSRPVTRNTDPAFRPQTSDDPSAFQPQHLAPPITA
jgi:hypothetical protein